MQLITGPATQAMRTAGREGHSSSVTQKDEVTGNEILSGFPFSLHPEPRLSQTLLTKAHPTPSSLGKSPFMSKSSFSCCSSGNTWDLQSRL